MGTHVSDRYLGSKGEKIIAMDGRKLEPWVILNSRNVFVAAPWIRVSLQQVRLPDGRVVDDYHQVALPGYAVIFAQTSDGRVIVERQYKHGVGEHTLVLPSGIIDKDEEPLLGAKRELTEETGFASEEWRSLGSFVVNGNYGCGKAHLFTARNARQVARADAGDLEHTDILLMRVDELTDAVRGGQVVVLGTVAAIALSLSEIFAPHKTRGPRDANR
jgi:ADP-ribose pyrophosphatase